MLSLYEFDSYREYLSAWIESQGARKHGMKLRISEALSVSSSLISQILKGLKTLTPDQTSELCHFIGFSETESDYFHLLVDFDRAASKRYRDILERKIRTLKLQSKQLGKRVPRSQELSDEQKAIYYSSWLYTGIRNLSAVPSFDQVDLIAKRLHLEPAVINRVVRFLIENGLCKEVSGRISYGTAATHVDKDSPFVNKHHQNWRFQAIQQMERKRDDDLFFTSPMSLSHAAFEEIRTLLPAVVQNIMKISGPSDSETVACLNIDWFAY